MFNGDSDNNQSIAPTGMPFSQACENNKQPILEILQEELSDYNHVLEVGSGTGQHSVYFATHLPHLQWQTSDVINNHQVIQAWHNAYPAPNLHAPLAFDLTTDFVLNSIKNEAYDAVFTANTLHIISWHLVERLFTLVGETLPLNGKLIVYGPFNENGLYTSASNQNFDTALRQRNPSSGIRHKEDIVTLAKKYHLILDSDYQLPANNQILIFRKGVIAS